MATHTITPTALVPGTRSGDIPGNGTDFNDTETFAINPPGPPGGGAGGGESRLVILAEEQDGSAATVAFDAGDNPPSSNPNALSFALAANDLRVLPVKAGEVLQSDGTITGTISGGVKLTVLALPTGY